MEEKTLQLYEPPVILTYTDEEILDELGPARTVVSGYTAKDNLIHP